MKSSIEFSSPLTLNQLEGHSIVNIDESSLLDCQFSSQSQSKESTGRPSRLVSRKFLIADLFPPRFIHPPLTRVSAVFTQKTRARVRNRKPPPSTHFTHGWESGIQIASASLLTDHSAPSYSLVADEDCFERSRHRSCQLLIASPSLETRSRDYSSRSCRKIRRRISARRASSISSIVQSSGKQRAIDFVKRTGGEGRGVHTRVPACLVACLCSSGLEVVDWKKTFTTRILEYNIFGIYLII